MKAAVEGDARFGAVFGARHRVVVAEQQREGFTNVFIVINDEYERLRRMCLRDLHSRVKQLCPASAGDRPSALVCRPAVLVDKRRG